jgi:16S rRNA (adenine1518-N6/adenine1519-N6)-dimethyltransferase
LNYIQRAKNFRAKKRLGQNFLVDESVINRIIEEANLKSDEIVIEIGSGIGFITEKLAQKAAKIIAVELDEEAIEVLKKLPYSNIKLIQKDILRTDFSEILTRPVKVIANIPYYITSPILAHLLGEIDCANWKNRELIKEIILMAQYEVAQRITANEKRGSKEYGALSVLVNFWCETEFLCKVHAKSFFPPPKVDSALLRLKIRQKPLVKPINPVIFRKVVQAGFGTRRKTIKNALVHKGFDEDKVKLSLEESGINPIRRGETLSIKEFCDISDCLAEK